MSRRPVELQPSTRLLIKQGLIGIFLACLVTTLLTGVWYGSRMDHVTIQAVEVTGGDTVSVAAVSAVAEEVMSGSYLRLVPRRFTWLYPEAELTEALREQFNRIDTLALAVEDTTLHITFSEYVPTALWCAVDESTGCTFLNETGFSFAPAPTLSGGTFIRYVVVGREPELRTYMIEPVQHAELQWFATELESVFDFYVQEFRVRPDEYATATIGSGRELRFSLRQDIAETFRYLETLLRSNEYTHLREDDFQYVDLRFGNRLFVNETAPELPVATSTPTTTDTGSQWVSDEAVPDGGIIASPEVAPAIDPAVAGVEAESVESTTTDEEDVALNESVDSSTTTDETATTSLPTDE